LLDGLRRKLVDMLRDDTLPASARLCLPRGADASGGAVLDVKTSPVDGRGELTSSAARVSLTAVLAQEAVDHFRAAAEHAPAPLIRESQHPYKNHLDEREMVRVWIHCFSF
jgi:hypothetical protein